MGGKTGGAAKNNRLHIYMFGLFYPAVLGTLVYGFLTSEQDSWLDFAFIILALAYFLIQFGENALKTADGYGWADFLTNAAELMVMILVFAALGLFVGNRAWVIAIACHGESARWLALFAAFALPPVTRTIRCKISDEHIRLGMLSLLACAGSVVGLLGSVMPELNYVGQWVGILIITAAMVTYIGSIGKISE